MRIQSVLAIAVSAWLVAAATANPAAAKAMHHKMMHKACSNKMMQACIMEKGGMKHTAMTSQCLAEKWGAKIVNPGPCKW
jgi:hypothetical protein